MYTGLEIVRTLSDFLRLFLFFCDIFRAELRAGVAAGDTAGDAVGVGTKK